MSDTLTEEIAAALAAAEDTLPVGFMYEWSAMMRWGALCRLQGRWEEHSWTSLHRADAVLAPCALEAEIRAELEKLHAG